MAWFTVPAAGYRLVKGTPTSFRSSQHASRTFCPACGTQLTFADDELPGEIDVTTASLDEPALVPPETHIYTATAVPWLLLGDNLPRYPASRSEG